MRLLDLPRSVQHPVFKEGAEVAQACPHGVRVVFGQRRPGGVLRLDGIAEHLQPKLRDLLRTEQPARRQDEPVFHEREHVKRRFAKLGQPRAEIQPCHEAHVRFPGAEQLFFKRPGKRPVKARKDAGDAALHGLRQDRALADEMRL